MTLPVGTTLGELELDEVLIAFDGPQLFVCSNSYKDKYLALHAPTTAEGDNWLYLRVSSRRLNRIIRGKISLGEAFRRPEHDLIELVTFLDGGRSVVRTLAPNKIPPTFLPDNTVYIRGSDTHEHTEGRIMVEHTDEFEELDDAFPQVPVWNLPEAAIKRLRESRVPVSVAARLTHRYVMDLMLKPSGFDARRELPISALGGILNSLQSLLDVLATDAVSGSQRGPVKVGIRSQTQLDAVAIFPSSFGIRIETHQPDLVQGGAVDTSFHRLQAILISVKSLAENVRPLSGRQRAHLKALLRALIRADADLTIELGKPKLDSTWAQSLSRREIAEMERLLQAEIEQSEEIREFVGNLVGVSLKSKVFLLENEEASIAGRISEACLSKLDGRRINTPHKAQILVLREVNEATGEESEKFTLMDIEEVQ